MVMLARLILMVGFVLKLLMFIPLFLLLLPTWIGTWAHNVHNKKGWDCTWERTPFHTTAHMLGLIK